MTRARASVPRPHFLPPTIRRSFMFGLGVPELVILALIILLLFGIRLPSVMRSLGQGVVEFKRGVQGIEENSVDAPKDNEGRPAGK